MRKLPPNAKQSAQLLALQQRSKEVIQQAKAGIISKQEAADRILELREEMEAIFAALRSEIDRDIRSI